MTRVLITGVNGFTGRHLVNRLAAESDIRIIGADLMEQPSPLDGLDEYNRLDVTDRDSVVRIIGETRPDWIFHLPAVTGGGVESIYRVNCLSGIYVMEAVKQYISDARVLLVGSAAEYGKVDMTDMPVTEDHVCSPLNHYGASKAALTAAGLAYSRQDRLDVRIARPFNIIGPGIPEFLVLGAMLRRALRAIAEGAEPVVTVGNLDTVRDFIAVEDVAEAYVAMMCDDCSGEVINVCSGRPTSIRDLADAVVNTAPRKLKYGVDPELMRPADVPVLYGSGEKAERMIGFKARISFEESVADAWSFLNTETDYC